MEGSLPACVSSIHPGAVPFFPIPVFDCIWKSVSGLRSFFRLLRVHIRLWAQRPFSASTVKGPFSPGLWFLWQYISLKYLRGFFSICFQSAPHTSNHTHTFKYLVLKSPVALCFLNLWSFSLNLMVANWSLSVITGEKTWFLKLSLP